MSISIPEAEEAIGLPFERWAQQCHVVSLALVKSGLVEGRVARGWCDGVTSQHSWVVLGDDCYDEQARVLDPTLWSYDSSVTGIWEGRADERPHLPHGAGSIWDYGRPPEPTGPIIELDVELSPQAQQFLELAAPGGLDRKGWRVLAQAPVGGWPAAEIFAAMDQTAAISHYLPIDKLGMITDLNPGGLYLRDGS